MLGRWTALSRTIRTAVGFFTATWMRLNLSSLISFTYVLPQYHFLVLLKLPGDGLWQFSFSKLTHSSFVSFWNSIREQWSSSSCLPVIWSYLLYDRFLSLVTLQTTVLLWTDLADRTEKLHDPKISVFNAFDSSDIYLLWDNAHGIHHCFVSSCLSYDWSQNVPSGRSDTKEVLCKCLFSIQNLRT